MKKYACTDAPIQTHGLIRELLPERFYRLPLAIIDAVPEKVANRAKSPVGGRIRLRTNSETVTVRIELETMMKDWAIALSGSAGGAVYVGMGTHPRYAGIICSRSYDEKTSTLTFAKKPEMEDITIFLPRNEVVSAVEIELDVAATVEAPTPYAIEKPVVFYGSSITEGGCASRVTNAYTALLSKWLNADYINLGFSGAALGEPMMAEYIAGLPMSAFVYDYDHNSPSPEFLWKTHEPFFKIIRERNPELPILIMSKPDFDAHPEDSAARREAIRQTYLNAIAAGDKHVVFVDGETYFGEFDREECTVEGCHPNDVGFMRMAKAVYPALKELLNV